MAQKLLKFIFSKIVILLLIAAWLIQCSNPAYIIYGYTLVFHSDIETINIDNLTVKITASELKGEKVLTSEDFSVCPVNNPGCDRKWVRPQIPDYTTKTLMTPMGEGEKYYLTEADGVSYITITLSLEQDSVLNQTRLFDNIIKHGHFLIYIGVGYDESIPAIKDFITYRTYDSKIFPNHWSFPIDGTVNVSDSLYFIWVE